MPNRKNTSQFKVGLVARCDNSGLGVMSEEFFNHIPCEKVLLVSNGVYVNFPERFGKTAKDVLRVPTDKEYETFFEGLTVAVFIETPYNWNAFRIAKKMRVKTVLIPMYECLRLSDPQPDWYACVSKLDYDLMPPEKRHRLTWPVDTDKVRWKRRGEKSQIFIHNAGHGGLLGRNGTDEVLQAAALLPDIQFILRSQFRLECSLPNVEVRVKNMTRYEELWEEGDAFVLPHKFNGLSLPIQEALAAGMPAISTDMYPFNDWVPKDFLVPVEKKYDISLSRPITASFVSIPELVSKIRWASERLPELSDQTRLISLGLSWHNLQPMWIDYLQSR